MLSFFFYLSCVHMQSNLSRRQNEENERCLGYISSTGTCTYESNLDKLHKIVYANHYQQDENKSVEMKSEYTRFVMQMIAI